LVNYLALLGWAPSEGQSEILSIEKLIQSFDLGDVSKSPAVFDLDKLYWINRHYLAAANASEKERIVQLVIPYLQQSGVINEVSEEHRKWILKLIDAFLGGVDYLSQIPAKVSMIFDFDQRKALDEQSVKDVLSAEGARQVIQALHDELVQKAGRVVEDWKEIIAGVKKRSGMKGKHLFHPIRVALTGSDSGPELDKLIPIIEEGSLLTLPKPVPSCRDRVARFLAALDSHS